MWPWHADLNAAIPAKTVDDDRPTTECLYMTLPDSQRMRINGYFICYKSNLGTPCAHIAIQIQHGRTPVTASMMHRFSSVIFDEETRNSNYMILKTELTKFLQFLSSICFGISRFPQKVLGEALMNSGPVLLLCSLCNSTAIFSGALLPVPLMRTFCLQAGIVSCLQALSALLLQPALLSLDLQRRRAFRVDFLCCLSSRPENPLTLAGRPSPLNATSAGNPPRPTACRRCLRFLSPRFAVRRLLVPCLRRIPAKALVVTVAAAAVGASGFGIAQLSYGLDFAAVVPRDSSEHDFVKAHHRFLGVYNFQVRKLFRLKCVTRMPISVFDLCRSALAKCSTTPTTKSFCVASSTRFVVCRRSWVPLRLRSG